MYSHTTYPTQAEIYTQFNLAIYGQVKLIELNVRKFFILSPPKGYKQRADS